MHVAKAMLPSMLMHSNKGGMTVVLVNSTYYNTELSQNL